VVCQPDQAAGLASLIMRESSAIGVRRSCCDRFILNRRSARVTTDWGSAGVKLIFDQGRFLRLTAEYDDCRKLAEKSGQTLQQIYRQVENIAYGQLDVLIKESGDE
jgi:uncharacterized protein (DUF111 family)